MGSRIVQAITEQRGNFSTNSSGLIPSTSAPIEQKINPRTFVFESNIQQLPKLQTSTVGGASTSKPILQRSSLATITSLSPEDGASLQQIKIEYPQDLQYDGILQQIAFNNLNNLSGNPTSSHPVEQRITRRKTDALGTPIEQKSKITNTVIIEQFEFIELVFPPCGSIKNPVNSNLLWRIRDFGFPFDVDTLIFQVNGVDVQDTSDFTQTDLGNGLELFYNPPENFQFDSTVTVYVEIRDTADPENIFVVRCNFLTVPDTRAPIISNVVPCGQTDVSINSPVSFDVIDVGYGVDLSSITLTIEGLTVCSGITTDAITVASGTGYHVLWEHPERAFRYASNVTVGIEAADLSPLQNRTLYICSFDTEESNPPYFVSFDPEPCSSFIDTDTGLRFEVYGNVAGLDISTLEVRVDNNLRTVIVRPRVLRSL